MKKLTMRVTAALLVSAVLAFSSCSKEGPAGATGPAGPAGPTGGTGAQGPIGTANVIYSEWTDTLTYYLTSETTTDTIFGDLDVPALTADILNSGEIKVYVNLNTADDPLVVPLPYSNASGAFIEVYFFTGGIEIVSNLNISGWPIRYILIPGGVAAGRKSGIIDWNNYAEVKKYLNLKD